MTINAVQVDSKNILVIDETFTTQRLPSIVTSIKMTISSNRISTGSITDIDVLNYMLTYRVDNEMYRITSETLNMGSGLDIPDGVYMIQIIVNNAETADMVVVVLNEIEEELSTLANKFSYDAGLDNISFFTPKISNDTMKFNYSVALYNKLILDISKGVSTSLISSNIDKLKRILNIVNK